MAKEPKITEKDIPYLIKSLKEGKSFTQLGEEYGLNYRTISYYIRKLDLFKYTRYSKIVENSLGNYFEVIDTPEKAYILGFVLGDGSFSGIQKDYLDIAVALGDKCVLDFMSKYLNTEIHIDKVLDKKHKRFPKARITKTVPFLIKHLGGRLKPDRHFPRIKKELERYMVLGFFDADGSIASGYRKDRNRFWVTISFVHHLKCLTGLQQFLYKRLGISTIVAPRSDENAYVIRFANKKDVLKFIDFIYPNEDFIVLKRKYEKAKAVRLEWGENGEGAIEQ